jgi:transposase
MVEDETMYAIGVDPHKATLAACAVDALGAALAEQTFANDPAGHAAFRTWASAVAPAGRVGLEGSAGYGAALARDLVAHGWSVCEVPPQLSHRERLRTRRAGKSDPGDALAIARVTAREPNLPPVRLADPSRELQLLVEAREDLVTEATRVRNRLHADLVVLLPGYQTKAANLVALRSRRSVEVRLRPLRGIQAELARDRLSRLGRLMAEAAVLERRIGGLVADHPLQAVAGAGPLTTAKIIGEAGDLRRFRSADAFAMLAGVAPIPASSGQTNRMRLNRGGNRQLNRAFHSIALVQAQHHPPAKAFIARKRAEGKTRREAIRALKRHVARAVFRILVSPPMSFEQAA